MILQTKLPLKPIQHNPISYDSNVLLLGSCFSENIGEKLAYFKFQIFQNPLGILFHPKGIERLILNSIKHKNYIENDIFLHNEQWHSFDAHSRISSSSKEKLLENLNAAITSTNKVLESSSHIIITLGSAWGYRCIESDKIVANCHKIPRKKFLKELLSIHEITESLETIISLIRTVNQKASIIFTISPVRHLKDGFVENQHSKSHLISATHNVINENTHIHYFPSYEIMMDELRDYRFYKEDMVHPNNIATSYIWGKFKNVWMSDPTQKIMKEVEIIQKGLAHIPFNTKSKAHKEFLIKIKEKIRALEKENKYLSFNTA